jgi:hypothetical protein
MAAAVRKQGLEQVYLWKAKQKWVGRLQKECCLEVPKPQGFFGVCRDRCGQSLKTGLCVINSQRLGYVSSTPPTCGGGKSGEILASDGQTGAVIVHGLQGQ